MLRVVPTHEGLGGDDVFIGERDQRLEVDLHLVALDRMVQGGVEVEPPDRTTAHPVDVEEGHLTATPTLLRPIHSNVGIVQEVVAGHPLVAQRHADAHRGNDLMTTAEDDGLTEHLEDPVGHLVGVVG